MHREVPPAENLYSDPDKRACVERKEYVCFKESLAPDSLERLDSVTGTQPFFTTFIAASALDLASIAVV